MRIEQFVIAHFAEQLVNGTVERIIQRLHQSRDGMASDDDSGLQSFWEEICVQVQGEEGSYFEDQISLVERLVQKYMKHFHKAELLALWLETIDGSVWRDDNAEEPNGHEIAPICLDDISRNIVSVLLNRAMNFENDSIYNYLHNLTDGGDDDDNFVEDEEDDVDEVESEDADENQNRGYFDFLTIVISREDILDLNIAPTLDELNGLIESPSEAREWFENVDIVIDGYNETTEELFEITEVRNFIQKLDEAFPFWLFFLSKRHLGLQCISLCFLPPYLTDAAKLSIFPVRLDELFSNRWFPAMNQICSWTEMSEDEIESLTTRSVNYLLDGPNSECVN